LANQISGWLTSVPLANPPRNPITIGLSSDDQYGSTGLWTHTVVKARLTCDFAAGSLQAGSADGVESSGIFFQHSEGLISLADS